MAIIEIAKIKVRRGLEGTTGMPALDSGEFGWAIDNRNLYIGNGTLAEGAPEVGNTRILTEHDANLFSLITTSTVYSYLSTDNGQHRAAGVAIYTDPSSSTSTYRIISSKLNDFATIYDFGGINDGVFDNTFALQNAIDQLWLNSDRNSARSRAALRIPAGIYLISNTITLPPYTTLIGEGQEKTVIQLTTSTTNKGLFQTCDQSKNLFGSLTANISNVNLIGISFNLNQYATTKFPILRMDSVTDSQIIDCKFRGQYPAGNSSTVFSSNYSGIEIRSSGAYNTKDLLIKNCTFDGLAYGIYSNYDIEDVVVDSCIFRNSNRGIAGLTTSTSAQSGPVRTKIQNNKFESIEAEGIYFGNNANNNSAYNISTQNTFKEVGNNLQGDASAKTAVINFQSRGNRSIEDYFDRYRAMNAAGVNDYYFRVLEGRVYEQHTGVEEISINTGTNTVTKFPIVDVNQTVKMQYTVSKPATNIHRTGELTVQVSVYNLVPSVSITDNYTYNGANDGLIEFGYQTNTTTNTLLLNYTNLGTAEGVMRYKFNQLQ
jgi:hypothetical protein